MWWPARFRKPESQRVRVGLVTEVMEPRILYSADIAGGLLLASGQSAVAEQRTLDATGEYTPSAGIASETAAVVEPTIAPVVAHDAQSVAVAYAAAALSFETNVGQAGQNVDFVAQGSGYDISLSGGSVELRLTHDGASAAVQLGFDGGNGVRPATAQNLLVARSNYLVGNDSAGWLTGIANYGAISYHDVYDGVDVLYYGTQRQLEYDFVVAAGANADQIRLRFTGAQASIDAGGDLILALDGSAETLHFKAPVSYQDGPSGRQSVVSSYQIRTDGSIGFSLGDYDHTKILVIDPVLAYASYFGGTGNETALGVATGSDGSVYITGRTTSSLGSLIGGGGSGDVFVAKFSADLSTLIYSARIGGTGDEQGNSIAVDSTGNASVTGWTKSSNFPTVAAAQGARSGSQDAFVFRLNSAGSGLAFSTFLGGLSGTDEGMGIAVDSSGNVYATGQRSQALVPVLTGLGGSLLGGDEAFVVKYDTSGAVQYSQFFGGSGTDSGVAIAVDSSGSAYIVGQSDSSNLPMVNANDTTVQSDEGFIARINAAGNSLVYSSFIGGNKKDFVTAVAVDASGKAYVTGTTEGKDTGQFAVTAGAFQTTNSGSKQSGFVRVYDTGLSGAASLLYSSFLGGSNDVGSGSGDSPSGIAIDAMGRAVIVGRTATSDFPVSGDAYSSVNASSGSADATFLVVVNPVGGGSGDLVYGTFFGSASATGSVAMSGGKAYFVASTATSGLSTAGVAQPATAGGSDAVVVGFNIVSNTAPVIAAANGLTSVLEDSASNTGTLVSALIAGQITDTDSGALTGIAVTGLVTANGAWQYSLNGGTSWNAFGVPSSAAATLLGSDALTRVRFVPNADFAGTVSGGMSFRAWDRTSGTAGNSVSTTSNGGTTAFSTAIVSTGITVTAVNDAPLRTAGTVANLTVAEDSGLTSLGLGSLAYGPGGGADETGQSISYSVTAVPLASQGSIVLGDGVTVVSVAGSYSLTDLQGMQFRTAANANGGPYTFSWSVTDNGGTSNGGVNTLAQSLTITVTAVNDAPAISVTGAVNVDENTTLTLAGASAPSVSDVDAGSASVQVTLSALNGQLTLNGSAGLSFVTGSASASASMTFTGTISNINTALSGLQYTPTANYFGSDTISFSVNDLGNTGSGGAKTTNATLAVTVNAVNQAPTLTVPGAQTTPQPTQLTFSPAGGNAIRVADADAGSSVVQLSLSTATLGNGTLTVGALSGASVTAGTNGSSALTLQGTLAQLNAALDTLGFTATSGGAARIDLVLDDLGNSGSGGAKQASQQINITVGTDALPVISLSQTSITAVEDAAPLVIDAGITVSDADNATLASARVAITSGYAGAQDQLAFTASAGTGNIAASYSGGVLSLSSAGATATLGEWQVALRSVTYQNTSQAPATATRTLSFTLNDGIADGAAKTLSLSVTAVNDAPVISGTNNLTTIEEDAGTANATNPGTLVSVLLAGKVSDPDTGAVSGIAVTAVDNTNGNWQYTTNGGTTWQNFGSGVTAGSARLLAADAMSSVRFVPTANFNGTVTGGLTLRAWDQTSGSAGGIADASSGGGSLAFSSASFSASVSVTLVNDAPVASGSATLTAVLEDTTSPAGATVASLFAANFTNTADSGNATQNQLAGVAVVARSALASQGAWQFSTDAGTSWTSFGSLSDSTAVSLATTDRLRFLPASNYNGTPGSLTVRLLDNSTTVVSGATLDVSSNGGLTAVSAATVSLGTSVTTVNDAPTGTSSTVTKLEDTAHTFTAADFGFSDVSDTPANALLAVKISALPAAGNLTLDGVAVTAGQVVTASDISAGRLVFTPVANANGNGYASVSFQVQDDGGTGNGGIDLDPVARSWTINLTAVNDAPFRSAGTVANLSVTEGSGLTSLGLGSLAYGPGGGTDETAQTLSYTVTAIPAASQGSIVLADGTTLVSATTSYSLAQLQGMQFRTAASASGGPFTFSWSVTDNGGTTNGGINTLSQSLTVTVTASATPVTTPTPDPTPTPAETPAQVVPPQTVQPAAITTAPVIVGVPVAAARSSSSALAVGAATQADDGGGAEGGDGTGAGTAAAIPGGRSGSGSDISGPTVAQISQVSFVSAERREAASPVQVVAAPEFAQFNLQAGGVSVTSQEAERTLRSPAFLEQMDRMKDDIRRELNLDSTVAISAAGATFGVSVAYVLWMIRGGVLMGSYLSALPAWQVLDPLPVLERLKDPTQDDDDVSEDLSDPADDALQSLRGY